MAGWLADLPSRDHTSFTSVETSRKPTLASYAKARDPPTGEYVLHSWESPPAEHCSELVKAC